MTIVLVILLVVVGLAMMWMRSSGAMPGGLGGSSGRRRGTGSARPTYNDPDYRSSGSIGGRGGSYQDAGYRPTAGSERREPSQPAYDDDEFRSGGSIGG
jgi:hypothetical protein